MRSRVILGLVLLPLAAACSSGENRGDPASFPQGDGGSSDVGVTGDSGGPVTIDFGDGALPDAGTGASDTLAVTIRDFKLHSASDSTTVPDFENPPPGDGPFDDHDVVGPALGSDGKPVYKNATGTTSTTHGKDAFDKWYRDVPGVNLRVDYSLKLTHNPDGSAEYDSEKTGVPLSASDPTKMFFPIDDGAANATAFGNQGDPHNYSFTVEIHTKFTYKGGEYFRFRGDDDVFVFINRQLVINLGGIHGPETADASIDALGLTKGQEYTLDFFSAERHKVGSNILFSTTLDLRPVTK